MTERNTKRLRPEQHYSTPSYAERRSTEVDMLAANGGFGPDGFRTPLSIPFTPPSSAANTPTLGNQPFPGPVPARKFLEIVEKETGRKICDGTIISRCRTGSISAKSKDCGTCRTDIKDLKGSICKNWNNFKNDPSI